MGSPKTVDIIIPCFNPRSGWEVALALSVERLRKGLPEGALGSVIVVNDGSSVGFEDAVVERLMAQVAGAKLIEYPKNKGKGFAVRTGVRSSDAELQIYTDVDVPYEENSLVRFYELLAAGEADVVVASRGESYYESLSGFRRILSKSLRWLNGLLFGLNIKDTQGGLKGFNAAGKAVFEQTAVNRYLFDLEFIQKASKQGLRLLAVDVRLKEDIVLPSPSPMILLKELHNFIRLLIKR